MKHFLEHYNEINSIFYQVFQLPSEETEPEMVLILLKLFFTIKERRGNENSMSWNATRDYKSLKSGLLTLL